MAGGMLQFDCRHVVHCREAVAKPVTPADGMDEVDEVLEGDDLLDALLDDDEDDDVFKSLAAAAPAAQQAAAPAARQPAAALALAARESAADAVAGMEVSGL